MMFRGDQHVDDWADVAVDYLDGRLDQDMRMAVESHLAGCSDCTARLHRQQSVVRLLQETPLADPPEDLEYHAIGPVVFPSPGDPPPGSRVQAKRRTSFRWYRAARAWVPATVAVMALIAALVGYGLARSGSGGDLSPVSDRSATHIATTAAAATTLAASSASGAKVTEAASQTTAGSPPSAAGAGPSTSGYAAAAFAATADRKEMIRALQSMRTPVYVSFSSPTGAGGSQNATGSTAAGTETTVAPGSTTGGAASGTDTSAGASSDTSASGSASSATSPGSTTVDDTSGLGAPTTATATGTTGLTVEGPSATVSEGQAASIATQIGDFTGLQPLDRSLWLGGPTYAAFLSRKDADKLVDLVRSIGASLGLVVGVEGAPPQAGKATSDQLLEHKERFPVLAAHRALQPATWGYDFTTSTLVSANGGLSTTEATLPDQAAHVIVVIWISE